MNYPDAYVQCPNIGVKARFLEPNMPLNTGNPYASPYLQPDHLGVDYTTLPLQGVHAFNENYELTRTFDSSSDAALQCGFGDKYYHISRYINKRFITCVLGGVTVKLLFAQNPLVKGGRKAVSCLNIKTNEVANYKSVNACMRGIGLSDKQASGVISDYIKPGKVYSCASGTYKITYLTQ